MTPNSSVDTVIGNCGLTPAPLPRIRPAAAGHPVAAGPLPSAIQTPSFALGHAPGQRLPRGRADWIGSKRSARWACWVEPTGQAIGSVRSLDRATPMLPSSSHHPLHHRAEAGARRIPIADLRSGFWGKAPP